MNEVTQAIEEKAGGKPVNKKAAFIALSTLGALMVGMVAFAYNKKQDAAKRTSAEEAGVAKVGNKVAAEAQKLAGGVQQSAIGEGMKFDNQGNLLGSTASNEGVPENKTLGSIGDNYKNPGAAIEAGIQPTTYQARYDAGAKYSSQRNQDPDSLKAGQEVAKQEREQLRESSLAFCEQEHITGRNQNQTQSTGGTTGYQPVNAPMMGAMPAEGSGYQDPQVQRLLAQASAINSSTQGQGPQAVSNFGAVNRPLVSSPGSMADMRIGGGPEILVREGKWIDGVTVNKIETSFHDNPVTVMVNRDLMDRSGKWILIPQGSKVMGLAMKVQNMQQSRMFITFHRIIFPDGRSAYFPERQMPEGFNLAGVLGADGKVNNHWFKKFGAAIVVGVVEGLAASKAGNVRIDPLGGQTMDGSQYAVQAVSKQFNEVTKRMMDHYANLAPTITLKMGTPMKVYFSEDVLLNAYMPTSQAHWVKYPGKR